MESDRSGEFLLEMIEKLGKANDEFREEVKSLREAAERLRMANERLDKVAEDIRLTKMALEVKDQVMN